MVSRVFLKLKDQDLDENSGISPLDSWARVYLWSVYELYQGTRGRAATASKKECAEGADFSLFWPSDHLITPMDKKPEHKKSHKYGPQVEWEWETTLILQFCLRRMFQRHSWGWMLFTDLIVEKLIFLEHMNNR